MLDKNNIKNIKLSDLIKNKDVEIISSKESLENIVRFDWDKEIITGEHKIKVDSI